MSIEVFHTQDQNHVTAGAAPFWGSSFETIDMLYKLAANLVKDSRNVQAKCRSSAVSYPCTGILMW